MFNGFFIAINITTQHTKKTNNRFDKTLQQNQKGDTIVTSVENNLYIYTVESSYFYSASNIPDHTAHRIKVDQNSKVLVPIGDTSDISPKFKRAAQNRLTIISLNEYATQIEMLIAR